MKKKPTRNLSKRSSILGFKKNRTENRKICSKIVIFSSKIAKKCEKQVVELEQELQKFAAQYNAKVDEYKKENGGTFFQK